LVNGAAAGAGAAAAQTRTQPSQGFTGWRIPEQVPDDMAAAAAEEQRKKDEAEAATKRSRDAETGLVEAQAGYANAQRAELERRMQNSDMTDSEKEAARHALETRLAQMRETGANERNAATIAGEARNTDARITSENRNTDARIASENRNTDVRESGANSRAGLQAGVEMRGQDARSREAQGQFISSMLANRINEGRLSLDRATKIWDAYLQQAKLPSDILKSVSDAIQPMLPYMTNGAPGDVAPGFEDGGAYEALWKAAGAKGKPPKTPGYSNFNLMDLASQYGGGPGQSKMPPKNVDELFSGAGQVAQESISNPNEIQSPRTEFPSQPVGTMPSSPGSQMDPETEKRIFSSLGT
jgi:hypothetical protein